MLIFDADNTETSGSLFEVSGGWAAQTRWQRSGGHGFPVDKPYTVEDVFSKWDKITNFGASVPEPLYEQGLTGPIDDGRATHPASTQEAIQQVSILA